MNGRKQKEKRVDRSRKSPPETAEKRVDRSRKTPPETAEERVFVKRLYDLNMMTHY